MVADRDHVSRRARERGGRTPAWCLYRGSIGGRGGGEHAYYLTTTTGIAQGCTREEQHCIVDGNLEFNDAVELFLTTVSKSEVLAYFVLKSQDQEPLCKLKKN